jgi:rhomboid protease GluP
MYALVYIGVLLEPLLGRMRFLVAYLITGVIASTASLWWHDNTASAGASGAVFGMYGVFLALLSTKLIESNTRKALLSSIGLFVVFNLVYGMQGSVDNAAHIGGLVSGFMVGYILIPSIQHPEKKNRNATTLAICCVVVLTGIIIACKSIPNYVGDYLKKTNEVLSLQEAGMSYLKELNKLEDEEVIHKIDSISYPSWEKALRLISESEQLKVSKEVSARLPGIKEYYQYRERQCFFIRDYLVNTNEDSKIQAQLYSQKADSVVKLLNEN